MHWNYWNFTRQNLTPAEVGKENQTHRAFGKTHLEANVQVSMHWNYWNFTSMAHLWLEMGLRRKGMWCKTKNNRRLTFSPKKLWDGWWRNFWGNPGSEGSFSLSKIVIQELGRPDGDSLAGRRCRGLSWIFYLEKAPVAVLLETSVFSRTKRPFFSTDPHEVCEGVLPQIIVKRAMKQVSYAWQGATPGAPSIPARRLEPRMKHVVKPWENWDILCHHGRTLGSVGNFQDSASDYATEWSLQYLAICGGTTRSGWTNSPRSVLDRGGMWRIRLSATPSDVWTSTAGTGCGFGWLAVQYIKFVFHKSIPSWTVDRQGLHACGCFSCVSQRRSGNSQHKIVNCWARSSTWTTTVSRKWSLPRPEERRGGPEGDYKPFPMMELNV